MCAHAVIVQSASAVRSIALAGPSAVLTMPPAPRSRPTGCGPQCGFPTAGWQGPCPHHHAISVTLMPAWHARA